MQHADDLRLWYEQPAKTWTEALPLGNGHLGGMVFGGIAQERIQLNEDTLWSGPPPLGEGNDPHAPQHLAAIREACFAGRYTEASHLCRKIQGPFGQAYMPLSDLWIDLGHGDSSAFNYRRELNLATATHHVTYTLNGVTYRRAMFISARDHVLAIKLQADKPRSLTGVVRLESPHPSDLNVSPSRHLTLHGRGPIHADPDYLGKPHPLIYDSDRGVEFCTHVALQVDGGRTRPTDKGIAFNAATEITILLTAATDVKSGKPTTQTTATLRRANTRTFQNLEVRHVADYTRLFDRVTLQLGSGQTNETTDSRIITFSQTQDPGLFELLFHYGRYLMIAGSRPGTQALNLQGIWNPATTPPWSSNYTTNINTQMNYWPAETCNLTECHEPLFDLIREASQNGRNTAQIHYHCDGWVMHHNTDLWRKTSPVGHWSGEPLWANWAMGGAWLCRHLWEHYLFTNDLSFLRRAYPTLKGAACFGLDWLIENSHGELVTAPSTSPENYYTLPDGKHCDVRVASTMDIAILRDLFDSVIQAASTLRLDKPLIARLRRASKKLPPYKVGSQGQLQEWYDDVPDHDPQHRHISHLYGLYPANQITPDRTPDLAEACRTTLNTRGDVSTGWSMAWKVCCWARLGDGDITHRVLCQIMNLTREGDVRYSNGGVYANLFAAHPPFQIDANFGACAGIAEMLMQSHTGIIHLLPALPSVWSTGSVTGLRARGGIEVGLTWADRKLTSCQFFSERNQTMPIQYQGRTKRIRLHAKQALILASW